MPEPVLRASQQEVLKYTHGLMGISAVPGSGKTFTLSKLAAKLILTNRFEDDQEVLVVTFSNSAADNFASRIGRELRKSGLIEGFGYRVRTLHGLANDIIHLRPGLVSLAEDYQIIDESMANDVLASEVERYLGEHEDWAQSLFNQHRSENERKKLRCGKFLELMKKVASDWIAQCKDDGWSVDALKAALDKRDDQSELVNFCISVHLGYQRFLREHTLIDFADLISLAYKCLQNDTTLVDYLRHSFPFVLEDEAQDSSKLQQKIMEMITGPDGNWVRVGDPNQAIYESFTTANPDLLKNFVNSPAVHAVDLPESGRSALAIIDLANRLNDWVRNSHPYMSVRDALSLPLIQPTKPGDAQANPPVTPDTLKIIPTPYSPEAEADFLAKDIKKYLSDNPNSTVAVLASMNQRVTDLYDRLKKEGIPVCEGLMRLSTEVRLSAKALARVLQAVYLPENSKHLAYAYRVLHWSEWEDTANRPAIQAISKWLESLQRTEDFLYPTSNADWEAAALEKGLNESEIASLRDFRLVVYDWHQAASLPVDQLVQLIGHSLILEPSEMAALYRMAKYLADVHQRFPEYGNLALIDQLLQLAADKRKFFEFSHDRGGFNPELHKGEVVLATLHKSKGLEWDKVYLSSCNNYDFPSGDPKDVYTQEPYYLEGNLNLQAETLLSLKQIIEGKPFMDYRRGYAGLAARETAIRDRLRLLYVGITRARKSLTITCNSGRMDNNKLCLPIQEICFGK